MRTARYHDYVLLKVIMFIALVILGLFLYKTLVEHVDHVADDAAWEFVKPTCTADGYRYKVCEECGEMFDKHTIPATGHTPGVATTENMKEHTLTEGGSYESVVSCTKCNEELSRETVWVDSYHDVEIIETIEKEVLPTCTVDGSYELVKTCKGCEKEISRETVPVAATGHNHGDWEAVYSETTGTFALVGVCDKDGHRINITANTESSFVVTKDESVAPCCLVRYIITCTYQGEFIERIVEVQPKVNHRVEYCEDHDSYINNTPSYIVLPDPSYDAETGKYYYDISTPGIEPVGAGTYSEWDEYGFCLGKFVCYDCRQVGCELCPESYTYYVYVYSSEHDSRVVVD